jgi:5-methylcytosine-specific restriction endonuclease McrA
MAGQPATLTCAEWVNILNHFEGKCAYCGKNGDNLEHFIPLSQGGGTTYNNCVPACQSCNVLKGNQHPDDISDPRLTPGIQRIYTYISSLEEVK